MMENARAQPLILEDILSDDDSSSDPEIDPDEEHYYFDLWLDPAKDELDE